MALLVGVVVLQYNTNKSKRGSPQGRKELNMTYQNISVFMFNRISEALEEAQA